MRYSAHFYNERGEFSFFRLGYRSQADAEQDACDELVLPLRKGYRADIQARERLGAPAVILAKIASNGEITYVAQVL